MTLAQEDKTRMVKKRRKTILPKFCVDFMIDTDNAGYGSCVQSPLAVIHRVISIELYTL